MRLSRSAYVPMSCASKCSSTCQPSAFTRCTVRSKYAGSGAPPRCFTKLNRAARTPPACKRLEPPVRDVRRDERDAAVRAAARGDGVEHGGVVGAVRRRLDDHRAREPEVRVQPGKPFPRRGLGGRIRPAFRVGKPLRRAEDVAMRVARARRRHVTRACSDAATGGRATFALTRLRAIDLLRRVVERDALRIGAGDRVQRAGRVARLLEVLERLAPHRGIDVQVGDPDHGAELLQHEEARAVVDQRAPVATPDHVAFLRRQPRFAHRARLVREEPLAMRRLDHRVQELVQPVALDAARQREGIGALQLLRAGELAADVCAVRRRRVDLRARRSRRSRRSPSRCRSSTAGSRSGGSCGRSPTARRASRAT